MLYIYYISKKAGKIHKQANLVTPSSIFLETLHACMGWIIHNCWYFDHFDLPIIQVCIIQPSVVKYNSLAHNRSVINNSSSCIHTVSLSLPQRQPLSHRLADYLGIDFHVSKWQVCISTSWFFPVMCFLSTFHFERWDFNSFFPHWHCTYTLFPFPTLPKRLCHNIDELNILCYVIIIM